MIPVNSKQRPAKMKQKGTGREEGFSETELACRKIRESRNSYCKGICDICDNGNKGHRFGSCAGCGKVIAGRSRGCLASSDFFAAGHSWHGSCGSTKKSRILIKEAR